MFRLALGVALAR